MIKVKYKVVNVAEYDTQELLEKLLNDMVNDNWSLEHTHGLRFIFKCHARTGIDFLKPENKTTVDLAEAKAEIIHLNKTFGGKDQVLQITFNDDTVFRCNCNGYIQLVRKFNQFIKGL